MQQYPRIGMLCSTGHQDRRKVVPSGALGEMVLFDMERRRMGGVSIARAVSNSISEDRECDRASSEAAPGLVILERAVLPNATLIRWKRLIGRRLHRPRPILP